MAKKIAKKTENKPKELNDNEKAMQKARQNSRVLQKKKMTDNNLKEK